MNDAQANVGIDGINARYNTKMEGYTTQMSYMKNLAAIGLAIVEFRHD